MGWEVERPAVRAYGAGTRKKEEKKRELSLGLEGRVEKKRDGERRKKKEREDWRIY